MIQRATIILNLFKLILLVSIFGILIACGTVNETQDRPFDAKVSQFQVFKDSVEIDSTTKEFQYFIKWRKPYSAYPVGAYYIWVNDSLVTSEVSSKLFEADIVHTPETTDSIISVNIHQQVLDEIESDELNNERKLKLNITIWADLTKGPNNTSEPTDGEPVYSIVRFIDTDPPLFAIPEIDVLENQFILTWQRPKDIVDFYQSEADTGIIFGYDLKIYALDTASNGLLRSSFNTDDVTLTLNGEVIPIEFYGKKITNVNNVLQISDLSSESLNNPESKLFFVVKDSARFNTVTESANTYQLTVTGLKSESAFKIEDFNVYDVAGNATTIDSLFVKLTDDSKPVSALNSTAQFILDSTTAEISWDIPEQLKNGLCNPLNVDSLCDIFFYDIQIQELLVSTGNDTTYPIAQQYIGFSISEFKKYFDNLSFEDSTFSIQSARFTDTIGNIVPGKELRVAIVATDASGHKSDTVFIDVPVYSYGDTTVVHCPVNMVPIVNQDSSAVPMAYCIEQFEHRDLLDDFVISVTAEEAVAACAAVNPLDTLFDYHLCTEREWYRACSGKTGVTREYGAISPSAFYLEEFCNIGTDSAHIFEERREECITAEGVRDLPGQLQEWVALADTSRYIAVDQLSVGYAVKGASYAQVDNLTDFEDKFKYATCDNISVPGELRPIYILNEIMVYNKAVYTQIQLDTLFKDSIPTVTRYQIDALSRRDSIELDSLALFSNIEQIGIYTNTPDTIQMPLQLDSNGIALDSIVLNGDELYIKINTLNGYNAGNEKVYDLMSYKKPFLSFRCCATPHVDSIGSILP